MNLNNKCWYGGKCSQEKENCIDGCIRYNNMRILIENSNLPLNLQRPIIYKPQPCDAEVFDILEAIRRTIDDFVEDGKSLYLWSRGVGNGKTTWSCRLLLSYFNKIWPLSQLKSRGIYLYIPSLINALKTQFLNDKGLADYLDKIKNTDLLILDELGVGKLSDFDKSNLLDIIEYRLTNRKSTIFTSNLNEEQLEEQFGERLRSRIYNTSTILEFRGKDRRGAL